MKKQYIISLMLIALTGSQANAQALNPDEATVIPVPNKTGGFTYLTPNQLVTNVVNPDDETLIPVPLPWGYVYVTPNQLLILTAQRSRDPNDPYPGQ